MGRAISRCESIVAPTSNDIALLGRGAFVLLPACANIANADPSPLASGGTRELAVRAALGGTRVRIGAATPGGNV
jgi:hypothetical protein